MTKEDFEQLKSTVKQWLFHTGSLNPTDYANELKLKFIEPKEKQIIDLEWQLQEVLKDNDNYQADNEKLEKENAELKEKINILDNCDRLGDVITEAYKDQLTKAKEILKSLYFIIESRIDYKNNIGIADEMWRAEQFWKGE